ncbi:MAG: PilT/PilU family type 4a pilus ATPase [Lachnospiraceae bacterium]|nr:PilT/PilU family type 4a pilus ATPase [Lachnospiraceae bacterium]
MLWKEKDNMNKIEEILMSGREKGASDLHICSDCPLMFRIDGELVTVSENLVSAQETEELVKSIMTNEQRLQMERSGEVAFSLSVEKLGRVRISVFRQMESYAISCRLLAEEVPTPQQLGIPEAAIEWVNKRKGFILVTGDMGSGKSTTIASLLHTIIENTKKTVMTLEKPVEYLYEQKNSMVMQREIGHDALSYAQALRAALKQDTDVIFVGELCDADTVLAAITAAEAGCLVFSTLCSGNGCISSVEQLLDLFSADSQHRIRARFAGVLEGVIAQQLLPKEGGGRAAAFEVLLPVPQIRSLICEKKSVQISSVMRENSEVGMRTMDAAIYDLFMKSYISAKTAVDFAYHREEMIQKINLF